MFAIGSLVLTLLCDLLLMVFLSSCLFSKMGCEPELKVVVKREGRGSIVDVHLSLLSILPSDRHRLCPFTRTQGSLSLIAFERRKKLSFGLSRLVLA